MGYKCTPASDTVFNITLWSCREQLCQQISTSSEMRALWWMRKWYGYRCVTSLADECQLIRSPEKLGFISYVHTWLCECTGSFFRTERIFRDDNLLALRCGCVERSWVTGLVCSGHCTVSTRSGRVHFLLWGAVMELFPNDFEEECTETFLSQLLNCFSFGPATAQSCPWVGLTHGLGWVWVENFSF